MAKGLSTISSPKKKSTHKRMSQEELDRRVFGNAPDMSNVTTPFELAKGLTYYGNFYNKAKSASFVIPWIKREFPFIKKEHIDAISKSFSVYFSPTIFSLIMCKEKGGYEFSASDHRTVITHVIDLISRSVHSTNDDDDENDDGIKKAPEKKKVSPAILAKEKINNALLPEFEGMLDDWLKNREKYTPALLIEKINENEVKLYAKPVVAGLYEWISQNIDLYTSILNAPVGDALKEEYSTLSRPDLNRVIKNLNALNSQIDTIVATNSATRKKKISATKKTVKTVSPERLLKRFKYKTEDRDYSLTSVDPSGIIGSVGVFLFNTKYRKITVLIPKDGERLSIKGTSVVGFEETLSFTKSIRNPSMILPIVLQKPKQTVISHLKTNVNAKEYPGNGRCGNDTIILKIFK